MGVFTISTGEAGDMGNPYRVIGIASVAPRAVGGNTPLTLRAIPAQRLGETVLEGDARLIAEFSTRAGDVGS